MASARHNRKRKHGRRRMGLLFKLLCGAARAAALRLQAETVLGPWLAARGFAFQGVPG